MQYTPNFSDTRVINRIQKAVDFVIAYQSNKHSKSIATRYIHHKDHLGNARNELSKYLKNILFIEIDSNWNYQTGKCKKYLIDAVGLEYLSNALIEVPNLSWEEYRKASTNKVAVQDKMLKASADNIIKAHQEEIETGNFVYKNKSNRNWHPLQFIPSSIRSDKFAKLGYNHNYDIECCEPTLLLQYARKQGLTKETPYLDYLLSDRSSFRKAIAEDCSITEEQAKSIITSLFNGGILAKSYSNTILRDILKYDFNAMTRLQNCILLSSLREDIKEMWSSIKSNMSAITSKRLTCKDKAKLYRELEEDVMGHIVKYLKRDKVLYFIEHDGFRTNHLIDIELLEGYIRSRTGYVIQIDYKHNN